MDGQEETYAAGGARLSLHGTIFQLKLLMLTFLKGGSDRTVNFRLATEMERAEQFDDLVLESRPVGEGGRRVYRFLQAKHSQSEAKPIAYDALLNVSKGPFSLKKYFISYMKIKNNELFKNGEVKDYIMWTNTGLKEQELKTRPDKRNNITLTELADDECDILNVKAEELIRKKPMKYRLSMGKEHELYDILRNTSSTSHNGATDEEIEEFFQKLVFAVHQLNEEELVDVIKGEISKIGNGRYNLNNDHIDSLYNRLYVKTQEWMKDKVGRFLSTEHAKEFFNAAISLEVRSTALLIAAENNQLEIIEEVVAQGANIEAADSNGRTALVIAVDHGNLAIVKYLLMNNAQTSHSDVKGRFPLIIATENNNTGILNELLTHKADTAVADKDGRTAVIIATEKGYVDVLTSLISFNASTNVADFVGRSPVIIATENRNLEVLKLLVESGAEFIKVADREGLAPILIATGNEDLETVKYLVEHGVNLNAADVNGRSALVIAGMKGNYAIVRCLVESGANIKAADVDGQTALQFALKNNSTDIVRYLRDVKGATW